MGHITLTVLGNDPQDLIEDALDDELLTLHDSTPDGVSMAGLGALRLVAGASGRTALDDAIEQGAPAIIVDNLRSRKPMVQGGVDSARKQDISNLHEIGDRIGRCLLLRDHAVEQCDADALDAAIGAAAPDTLISLYDLHY